MKMKRQLVYIAGKYRAKTVLGRIINIWKARQAQKKLTREGYCVFNPHCNWGLMDGLQDDRFFLDTGLKILRHCDAIYMLKGWEKSEGARAELEEAQKRGLKVWYENGFAEPLPYKVEPQEVKE